MKVAAACVLLVACVVVLASAEVSANIQGDHYADSASELEAKLLADLAARIARAARMSPWGYMGGVPSNNMGKRNSELINSLLGLPKVLNDAGK